MSSWGLVSAAMASTWWARPEGQGVDSTSKMFGLTPAGKGCFLSDTVPMSWLGLVSGTCDGPVSYLTHAFSKPGVGEVSTCTAASAQAR